jgi:AraC family transcriptional regulator, melibiose operon regulatory protein
MSQSEASLVNVPKHERQFYTMHRAFGRPGMRIFKPVLMDLPHWHGHVEINLLTGAEMSYDLDDQRIDVGDGQPVIFWAGIPHQLTELRPTGDQPPILANLYFPVDGFLAMPHIAELQVALLGGALAALPPDAIDYEQMQRWYSDYRSGDVDRFEVLKMELNTILRRALIEDLVYLRQPLSIKSAGKALSSSNIKHVIAMVRYVLEHLSEPMVNADVTNITGLHENYALSLFSKTMRISLKRFIIQMRLIRARAALIESSQPITTVASEAGFNSISQFYAHFTSSYGLAPSELRRAYTKSMLR